MKKIFLLFFLCIMSFNVSNAKITWSLSDNGTLTISGTSMDNLSSIPWYSQCKKIKKIIIKDGVTNITGYAFSGCNNLISINIPNSVTSIGRHAFSSCYALTSIIIPNSVTKIEEYAFEDCASLVSIIVEEGNSHYDSRNNCNAIIETKSNTLIVGCMNTIIPNNVTAIGSHAFHGCSNLTSITIPEGVATIGNYAFASCSQLSDIIIPSSVNAMAKGCFQYCVSLSKFTCYSLIPPSVGSDIFLGVPYQTGTLYVPSSVIDTYKTADKWTDWKKIQPIDGFYTYTVTLDHNKGLGNPEQIMVLYGMPMPENMGLVAPTRIGYDFTGYYRNELCYYDAKLKSMRNFDRQENCTIYANWKAHTTTVNFDFQGGKNGTSQVTATYDNSMPTGIKVVAPAREGYTFGGYYDNRDGNGTQYYNADMTSKNPWNKDVSEITLYAKWLVIPVTNISLNVTTTSLWVGDTKELSATATPTTAYNTSVNWSSSNNNVATISSKGIITAKGKGTCTITCTAADGYGTKSTCEVTVKQPVTKIALSETTTSLWVGKTKTLTATATPTTANNTTVNWSSSNNSVATVSSKGVITAKGKGTCTITCTAADEYGTKATCKVTVKQQVNSIDFGYETLNVLCGTEKTLTPTINPSNADIKTLTWKSTDNTVATITSGGVLTAVSPGTATITCTATDDFKKSSSITVIVEPLDITITDKNPTIKEGTYREGGISYTRTLTKNKYTTFCMPYDVNLSDYTDYFSKVYVPMGTAFVKSGGKLTIMFKSVSLTETIRAGQPFIVLASKSGTVAIKNGSKVTITSVDEPQPTSLEVYNYGGNLLARNTDIDVKMSGNYSIVTDLDDANNFTFSVNGQMVGATTVSPYRFYITKNDDRSNAKITDMLLSLDGEEVTGIEYIINEQNGDDKFYNLNGQRINKTNAQKGVYIINGKKYTK